MVGLEKIKKKRGENAPLLNNCSHLTKEKSYGEVANSTQIAQYYSEKPIQVEKWANI